MKRTDETEMNEFLRKEKVGRLDPDGLVVRQNCRMPSSKIRLVSNGHVNNVLCASGFFPPFFLRTEPQDIPIRFPSWTEQEQIAFGIAKGVDLPIGMFQCVGKNACNDFPDGGPAPIKMGENAFFSDSCGKDSRNFASSQLDTLPFTYYDVHVI